MGCCEAHTCKHCDRCMFLPCTTPNGIHPDPLLQKMIERLRPGAEQMAREMYADIERIKNGENDSNQRY